jgi:uncharacterized protein YndB with AHSA1/START domain
MGDSATVTVHIDAPPERVYDLISDVTRMGEWSPECTGCAWIDGAERAAVGARFRGSNRRGWMKWSTTAEVESADPGREFTFATRSGKRIATRWRYVLAPGDGGTDVTESFEAVYAPAPLRLVERVFMRGRTDELATGMRTTLERIKAAAERTS